MPKNEIKVKISAETTQFERNIETIKRKLREAFTDPVQFSIGALSPWKFISDQIIKGISTLVDAFKNWRKGLEDISSAPIAPQKTLT